VPIDNQGSGEYINMWQFKEGDQQSSWERVAIAVIKPLASDIKT